MKFRTDIVDRLRQRIAAGRAADIPDDVLICGVTVAEARELLAELARLRAIVDKLPKTADGVPVYVGMRFWIKEDAGDSEFEGWIVTGIGPETAGENDRYDWVRTNGIGYLTTQVIYSTRAAAEAAAKEKR